MKVARRAGGCENLHVPLFKGRFGAVEGCFIPKIDSDKMIKMSFPIKTCVVCGEEFELKPDKPGFANRCPECSDPENNPEKGSGLDKKHLSAEERKAEAEANAERRKAIRDLLYKKDR